MKLKSASVVFISSIFVSDAAADLASGRASVGTLKYSSLSAAAEQAFTETELHLLLHPAWRRS